MTTAGERILRGARQAAAIAKGEADPKTYRVHVPENIDVAAIRRACGMTQEQFAGTYGFPVGSLRDWEQKRKPPSGAARVLLLVLAHQPKAVTDALKAAAGASG